MRKLIYLLIPVAVALLNLHHLIDDPLGFHVYTASQYLLIAYVTTIGIVALARVRGADMFRQVYPLLILSFFVVCLLWMTVEELAGGNRWNFAFTRYRLGWFLAVAAILQIFAMIRIKAMTRETGPLRPGVVYVIGYAPSTPFAWLAAVFTFQDHIGRGVYLDGQMYLINKETGLPETRPVNGSNVIGRAILANVSPSRFLAAWWDHTGDKWQPLTNNCRQHVRKVLKAAK